MTLFNEETSSFLGNNRMTSICYLKGSYRGPRSSICLPGCIFTHTAGKTYLNHAEVKDFFDQNIQVCLFFIGWYACIS